MAIDNPTSLSVSHQEGARRGSFFIEQDGKRLAEMTYARNEPQLVTIDHTKVDPSLEGKGIGRKLLDEAVRWARETHTKVIPTCSYAAAQFAKDPSIRDVLKNPVT